MPIPAANKFLFAHLESFVKIASHIHVIPNIKNTISFVRTFTLFHPVQSDKISKPLKRQNPTKRLPVKNIILFIPPPSPPRGRYPVRLSLILLLLIRRGRMCIYRLYDALFHIGNRAVRHKNNIRELIRTESIRQEIDGIERSGFKLQVLQPSLCPRPAPGSSWTVTFEMFSRHELRASKISAAISFALHSGLSYLISTSIFISLL